MSKVRRLTANYARHIAVPWRQAIAAPQRVIFCVYPEQEELRLRARLDEFELATKQAGHGWTLFDLTDTFPRWLASQRYAKSYFQQPDRLPALIAKYGSYIRAEFAAFLESKDPGDGSVVALAGVGSLFGFLKVKEIVDELAPLVPGRLLVFFPGSYENNNYRLLDGYDGWNYLAVAITPDKDF